MFDDLSGYTSSKLLALARAAYGDNADARTWIMKVIREKVEREILAASHT